MEKVSSLLTSIFGGRGAGADEGDREPAAKVMSLFVYPIKSCRGISVPQACVTSTGFRWDRQWLVVNSSGRAYTQRVEPKLALVEIELPADAFSEDWEPTDDSYMIIKAPEMDMLKVPLNREGSVISDVSVWEWSGSAFDEGLEAFEWFSKYLGRPSRLVRFNTCIIIVDGCDPFAEDLWTEMKINKLTFRGVKLCSRCKVPTIDQETAVAGKEPTETLVKFRSAHALHLSKKKQKGQVYFGQNLVCKEALSLPDKGKTIAVGDPVFVLLMVSSYAQAGA